MLEFTHYGKPVEFTRSRPYKKNDNCYVEQKNFTHVRELFGYERFEEAHLIDLMNEIYTDEYSVLKDSSTGILYELGSKTPLDT